DDLDLPGPGGGDAHSVGVVDELRRRGFDQVHEDDVRLTALNPAQCPHIHPTPEIVPCDHGPVLGRGRSVWYNDHDFAGRLPVELHELGVFQELLDALLDVLQVPRVVESAIFAIVP